MTVKKHQIYAELAGKKRYLRVDDITEEGVLCTTGWAGRGNHIIWSPERRPLIPESSLTDLSLYRLELDVE